MTSIVRPRTERGMPSAQKFPRSQDSRVRGSWQHWRRWALGLLALSCSVPGLAGSDKALMKLAKPSRIAAPAPGAAAQEGAHP